jgi:hypothetical protein
LFLNEDEQGKEKFKMWLDDVQADASARIMQKHRLLKVGLPGDEEISCAIEHPSPCRLCSPSIVEEGFKLSCLSAIDSLSICMESQIPSAICGSAENSGFDIQ